MDLKEREPVRVTEAFGCDADGDAHVDEAAESAPRDACAEGALPRVPGHSRLSGQSQMAILEDSLVRACFQRWCQAAFAPRKETISTRFHLDTLFRAEVEECISLAKKLLAHS